MFDKLKEAVSDVLGGHADDAKKAADQATGAVDEAKANAEGVIADTASGNVSADSLKADAGELGGMADTLKGSAGQLSGIADQLGGVGELKNLVSGFSYPIQKDEVVAQLQESGIAGKFLDLVKQYAGDRFNSPEEIMALIKGLL